MSQDDTDLVHRRAERFSALLRATDVPVPPIAYPAERIARAARRRDAVRWRAAAAIVLVAAGAIGVRPVRAWIVQAAWTLWTTAVGGAGTAAGAAASPAGSAGTVSFTPAGGPFVVRVVRPQAGGTLTIETTPGAVASAAVTGGGGVELVVLPDGVRIVNDDTSSASFLVRVPARLASVEVSIGGGATRMFAIPAGGAGRWVVDLGVPR
jgi:hypothetical protein